MKLEVAPEMEAILGHLSGRTSQLAISATAKVTAAEIIVLTDNPITPLSA